MKYKVLQDKYRGLMLLLPLFIVMQSNAFGFNVFNEELKVKVEILGQKYNSPTGITINFRVELHNPNDRPLIVNKSYFAVSEITFSDNLEELEKGNYLAVNHAFQPLHFNQLKAPAPPPNLFIILKPNSDYTTERSTFFMCDWNKIIPNREYYIRFRLELWGGQRMGSEKLRERWSNFGYLWLNSVKTEPLKISFTESTLLKLKLPNSSTSF